MGLHMRVQEEKKEGCLDFLVEVTQVRMLYVGRLHNGTQDQS